MPDESPLRGRGVVVTRPVAQAEGLCRAIEAAGGRAIRFPALEIQPLDAAPRKLDDAYDLRIYVSANAVRFGPPETAAPPDLLAVGPATRRALEARGLRVCEAPRLPYDSEALLALPRLRRVRGQRILIVRGEGGRERLADVLRRRGACVDYAQVYRRVVPEGDDAALAAEWTRGHIHAVTVASVATLENLLRMLGTECRTRLRGTPMVVASGRVLQKARALGFVQPIVTAADPGDRAMTQAVIQVVIQALSHPTDTATQT